MTKIETASAFEGHRYYFYGKRDHVDSSFFEFYRCFNAREELEFSARATRFGKPVAIFDAAADPQAIGEIHNRKGYLVNGRTDMHDTRGPALLGSYTRFGGVYDADDSKVGSWGDARSWSEEFKVNLIEAIGNALLGSGDAPAGANPSDTHLLTHGKLILAVLQREKLPFFPDPPRRTEPGKLARLARRVIPGELGKSLAEVTPPYGWSLAIQRHAGSEQALTLLLYSALCRIEYLRWSRSS